jgi:hypothetical protein
MFAQHICHRISCLHILESETIVYHITSSPPCFGVGGMVVVMFTCQSTHMNTTKGIELVDKMPSLNIH